jgi:hypothetical protein
MTTQAVTELIGVYHANGSWRGELAYVVKKAAGRGHCSLCDITHGTLRRRSSFDAACTTLGVKFTLLHRDERPPDVLAITGDTTPMVLGRTATGLRVLLGAEQLNQCRADPDALVEALQHRLAALGLRLASETDPPPAALEPLDLA